MGVPEHRVGASLSSSRAEMSSVATAIEELAARLDRMGRDRLSADEQALADELFGAEAALTGVVRRLRRMVDIVA